MRWRNIILFFAVCSFTAYYIYEPIPNEIEERWELMLTNCFFRTLSHLADLSEFLGLKDYMGVMYAITLLEGITPVSDEHVRVTEETLDGVEVIVYQPKFRNTNNELRRAVIYLHGGGWCLGSAKMGPYDLLARKLAKELDAVVVSVEYRLAPPHHFPAAYEDVYRVVKHFLQEVVLARFYVDPNRVAVSGDSAGGNLAAAVSQQLQKEHSQTIKLKVQALIYPVLQALDLNTPSYQQNRDMPILPRTLMVRFWSEYFTTDKSFFRAMMANTHNSQESSRLLKFVNWSSFLPETYHRKYKYSAPVVLEEMKPTSAGKHEPSQDIADLRASPLLAPDTDLYSLPKAYIVTCEYDVLRDDGIMYATRLRIAGVNVTNQHYKTGFHGAVMFTMWPTDFLIGRQVTENYVKWLKENL